MATESQIDLWRRNLRTNLHKAAEGAEARAREATEIEGIKPEDRIRISLAAAQAVGNLMIAERLGQIKDALYSDDVTLEQTQERVRTGEQIMQRFVDSIDLESMENPPENLVMAATMMEDWLDPEGLVAFASPEAVEAGRDPHSNLEPEEAEEGDPESGSEDEPHKPIVEGDEEIEETEKP